MIRLCVFDLDGTTVDSLASIAHFANLTLEENGFTPFPVDDYRHLAGGGRPRPSGAYDETLADNL